MAVIRSYLYIIVVHVFVCNIARSLIWWSLHAWIYSKHNEVNGTGAIAITQSVNTCMRKLTEVK